MITKVKGLTAEELRTLVSDTVIDSVQDLIEDMTLIQVKIMMSWISCRFSISSQPKGIASNWEIPLLIF